MSAIRAVPPGRMLGPVLAACMLLPAGGGPAQAHDELVTTSPRAGAHLASVPAAVSFSFNEPVAPGLSVVVVKGPDGSQLQAGAPRINGATVIQSFRSAQRPGTYRAAYRIVSADGHPVTGNLEFEVEAGSSGPSASSSPAASAGPSASATAGATAEPASPATTGAAATQPGASRLPYVLGGALVILLFAVAASVARSRRRVP